MEKYNNADYEAYIYYLNNGKRKKEDESEKYYKADLHIHSNYSWDSKQDIASVIKEAEKRKLKYIGFADHIDFGNEATLDVVDRIKKRNAEIDSLQSLTSIKILKGIEVGEPHLYQDEMKYLKRIPDLDYIIGSIHYLKRKSLRQIKSKDLINKYFIEVLNMVKNSDIDILGHIDYIKRYIELDGLDEDILYQILETIHQLNIALEINTSGLRRCGSAFPSQDILEDYIRIKGKKITYGSDAHEESELFSSIEDLSKQQKTYKLNQGIYINRKFKQI